MKHTFYVFSLILYCSIALHAQDTTSVSQEANVPENILKRSQEFGTINLNLFANENTDLIVLDSIINAMDSILNPRTSEAEIYGHHIFRNDSIKIFQKGSIVKVPDDYVIGIGDEIAISIFGASQFDGKYIIDQDGFIQPKEMPKILLKGLSWGQARLLLQRRFSNYFIFRAEQFAVRISEPRTIIVNVFGEIERPGSYSLIATNTAFNALIAAGGPTDEGSLRNILVINGKTQKRLDIYNLMTNPTAQFDFYLEDNIIIQVPTISKVVELEGAVQRPLKYELLAGEGLVELINFAGGLSANAVKEVVQIKRYINDEQIIIDINLKEILEKNENFALMDGDVISIRSIEATLSNLVSVEGAVELPGDYSIQSTPRISTLLKKAILKREASLENSFLIRLNPDSTLRLIEFDLSSILSNPGSNDDLELEPFDRIIITDSGLYVDHSTISVKGAVRKEIEYPFDAQAQISLNQIIALSGGLDPEARDIGYIIRSNPNNRKEVEYIKINVRNAVLSKNSADNINLRGWDRVIVLAAPKYVDRARVTIRGAVREPGTFRYDESLSLSDLIILANGLKTEASRKIQIYRLRTDQNQATSTVAATLELDEDLNIIAGPDDFKLEAHDEVVVRYVPEFKLQKFIEIKGEVAFPGEYALTSSNETLASIVRRSGGLTVEAFPKGSYIIRKMEQDDQDDQDEERNFRVVTRLEEVLKNENSKFNYILKEGDIITIPTKEDVVYISVSNTRAGELFLERKDSTTQIMAVVFESGKTAKWYIDEFAGGLGHHADKGSVTVQYANGAIKRTRGGLFKKFPGVDQGAMIMVGSKMDRKDENSLNGVEKSYSDYPNLNRGVIVNVGADGTVVKEELEDDPNNNQEQ